MFDIDINGVIIGLLLIAVYYGLFAALVLKFKRRTAELKQQVLVASQRKFDALHHVCHALFRSQCTEFYQRFTKNESFDEALFNVKKPEGLTLTFEDFEFAMKARLLRGIEGDMIAESVAVTPFVIMVKNQLSLYPGMEALVKLVESPENDFRRLMLLYRNEANALNKLIDSPWTWVSSRLVGAKKQPVYNPAEGGKNEN